MLSDQLVVMQKHESAPCISIVVALDGAQDKKAALQLVNQSIEEAAEHLRTAWPDKAAALINALNELSDSYKYSPADRGIGLYVALSYNKLFRFSLPVQAKVCIGEKFAVRELLYQEQYGFDYLVLHLEEKMVQLYRGRMDRLEQINDNNFPFRFTNEYDYTPPTLGDMTKDKSVITGLRQKNFYRAADKPLEAYLHGQPLILTGPTKDIGYFEDVTTHKKDITAYVHGNFSNVPMKALEDKVWPAVKSFIEMRDQQAIRELEDSREQVVDGIRDVLDAARDGRGGKLLVEKDFNSADFTDKLTGRLRTRGPEAAHAIDAVEDAMRAVIDKNGEIIFVKDGVLEDHKHIALITRY
ncbi:hypothetical protein [Chitinophaga sp.]|uniref:baeRF3 domain-containing protein n=1 Tax=Chitinophaga sp. TaxID=1869181 RepID=UPI0031E0BBE3